MDRKKQYFTVVKLTISWKGVAQQA